MSYVFFPPRTDNYFPPGPPYLAGFGGLGDYAADLAAYKTAYDKWRLAKASYTRNLTIYQAKVKSIDDTYAAALAAYNKALAQYEQDYAAFVVATNNFNAAFAQYRKANEAKSMAIAKAHGMTLSAAYYNSGACVSQAQHDAYARNCSTVKGLGYLRGLGSSDPDCGGAKLPVCQFGKPPVAPTKPTPPVRAAYPSAPIDPGPAPIEPKAPPAAPPAPPPVAVVTPPSSGGGGSPTTVPVVTPVTTPTVTPVTDDSVVPVTSDSKQANVLMNGLVIVAVLGGGYLVWRTLKKPKAA